MKWNSNQIKKYIACIAETMKKNKDYLIELDSVFGDGDLGLTMSDGFAAACRAVAESDEKDCGKLLYMAGKAMSSAVPSTMGTLMANGLMSAGKALKGSEEIENGAELLILKSWMEGVMRMGKAKTGEKTFLDGLAPAVAVLEKNSGASMREVAGAAKKGAQSTIDMLAVHGRAAIRGEASKGHIDPGAVVADMLVEAMAECETII